LKRSLRLFAIRKNYQTRFECEIFVKVTIGALSLQERISNIAYNIVNGRCVPVRDQTAPVYITIGDGGNIEGLATR
jgi:hypothetical protein